MRSTSSSVLPLLCLVTLLCLTMTPVPAGVLLSFWLGALLLMVGMGLFELGAENSMTPIGSRTGAALGRSRSLWTILAVSFVIGAAVTVAEPDLQVLAATVPQIDTRVLVITVGVGVGIFLALCMLRIFLGIRLRWLLLGFYGLLFLLAAFARQDFLAVAFDAGGVTTGPMTVPFILALGMGVSRIRSDRTAEADSFGLVALCSIGPILAVLLLGFFYTGESSTAMGAVSAPSDSVELGLTYWRAFPVYMGETALSLAPVAGVLLLFQLFSFRMKRRRFWKICLGILYTYMGLVFFLTGVNVGFSPMGHVLGAELAEGWTRVLLIPLAMLLGCFGVSAEPAVHVLETQIQEVSAGAIPGRAIRISLCAAVSLAMGLSVLRVITGISLMWFVLPGYALALLLTFFVPDLYTAIAFDSGGVASGPLTATFILQFVLGAGSTLGADVLRDCFGLVALVAMMPLLSVQLLGFIFERRRRREERAEIYGDEEIIELWEVAS